MESDERGNTQELNKIACVQLTTCKPSNKIGRQSRSREEGDELSVPEMNGRGR